ncbi:Immunoglobulin-like domain [Trinorchestia longiramus]|nr:Immunoglobulin-like domain [Trinorchestia longiramus]
MFFITDGCYKQYTNSLGLNHPLGRLVSELAWNTRRRVQGRCRGGQFVYDHRMARITGKHTDCTPSSGVDYLINTLNDAYSSDRFALLSTIMDDTEVVSDRSKNILVTEDSLVLQRITPDASGDYSCRADNIRGADRSDRHSLSVKFTPRCRIAAKRLVVTSGSNVSVECSVDAQPPPNSFSWSLNSSQGLHIMHESQVSSTGRVSSITRLTPTDLTSEQLLCWATNDIGAMHEPCITTLVAAGEHLSGS